MPSTGPVYFELDSAAHAANNPTDGFDFREGLETLMDDTIQASSPELVAAITKACDGATDKGNLLRVLVDANGLRELLCINLKSDNRLARLAMRSSVHENGFVKIPLFKNEAIAVRLHIWKPAKASSWAGNIHDHRFAFWSHVISGTLIQRRWNEATSGEVYSRYRYVPGILTGQQILNYDGEYKLRHGDLEEIHEGHTYFLHSGVIHQTAILPEVPTITLLVEDRSHLRPHALVFSRRYPRRTMKIPSAMLSTAMCRELMHRVLTTLC